MKTSLTLYVRSAFGLERYMTCPCKDCEARTLNCHDRCVQYSEWKNSLPKKKPELARDLLWDGIQKAVRRKNKKSKLRNYGGEK